MWKTSLLIALLSFAPGAALAQAEDAAESDAYALFRQAFSELCLFDEETAAADYYPPESWELTWQPEYSDEPETATLHKFFCFAGAYNVNHMYYIEREYDGPVPVAFATPAYDVVYENDDFEGEVLDIPVTGYDSELLLVNSEFDPETETITSHSLWRGLGDAYSAGVWQFDQGQFILKRYEVDGQYDGEARGKTIVSFE